MYIVEVGAGAGLRQQVAEHFLGAEQLSFHGAERNVELCSDLFVAEFLEIAQFDHQAVLAVEAAEHFAHQLNALAADDGLFGVQGSGPQVAGVVAAAFAVDGLIDGEHVEALLANVVDAVVDGDAEQPGAECVTRHVAVDLGEGLAKGFNGQVFGIFPVFDHLQHHVKDGVAVTLQEDGVSLLIAFDGFLDN